MYEQIVDEIYGVIDAYSGSLTLIPNDYVGSINAGNNFGAVQIIVPSTEVVSYGAKKRAEGMVIVALFTEAGKGDKQVAASLDTLDSIFQGTTSTNNLQFMSSYYQDLGRDSENTSLRRIDYTVPFTYYGDL